MDAWVTDAPRTVELSERSTSCVTWLRALVDRHLSVIRQLCLCASVLMVAPLAVGAAQRAPAITCPAAVPRGSSRFHGTGAVGLAGTFDLVLVPPASEFADSVRHAVLVLRPADPAMPALRVELADTTRHIVGEQPALWGYLADGTQLYSTRAAPANPARPDARVTEDGQLLIGHARNGGVLSLQVTHVTPTGFLGRWLPPPTITPHAPQHGRFCAVRR